MRHTRSLASSNALSIIIPDGMGTKLSTLSLKPFYCAYMHSHPLSGRPNVPNSLVSGICHVVALTLIKDSK